VLPKPHLLRVACWGRVDYYQAPRRVYADVACPGCRAQSVPNTERSSRSEQGASYPPPPTCVLQVRLKETDTPFLGVKETSYCQLRTQVGWSSSSRVRAATAVLEQQQQCQLKAQVGCSSSRGCSRFLQ